MLLTEENETRIEFLVPGIVKIKLDENYALSAQLMREVQVSHKVKTGQPASAFLFQIIDPVSKSWIDSLLRKTARIAYQQTPVALLFESQSQIPFTQITTTDSAFRIFSNLREAHDWLNSLHFSEKFSLN